jgi:hypothetical protein
MSDSLEKEEGSPVAAEPVEKEEQDKKEVVTEKKPRRVLTDKQREALAKGREARKLKLKSVSKQSSEEAPQSAEKDEYFETESQTLDVVKVGQPKRLQRQQTQSEDRKQKIQERRETLKKIRETMSFH